MSKELKNLRKLIDKIDFEILQKLAKRFFLVSKIAEFKAKNNLSIYDKKREKDMLKTRKILANQFKLNKSMIGKIFRIIFKESRFKQENDY